MIRDLQFFTRICKENSIRKAAESLFITQQGLSKAMKNLESELGVQLFTRSNEGIVLTKAGKIVAKRSKNILDEFSDMKMELREHVASSPNQIRIAFASGVIDALQTDFLYDYQDRYPEIDVVVTDHPDTLCEEAVINNEADLGFTIGPIDKRKFSFFEIRKGRIVVLANSSHPVAGEKRLRLRNLAKEKWALPNEKFKSYHNIVSKCAELGIKPKVAMLASEMRLIYKYCHLNHGIGLSPDSERLDSRFDDVVIISLDKESQISWNINLIIRKNAPLSPAATSFVEHVRSFLDLG